MTLAAALVLAWLLDAAFGEPRNAWHPVAWLGRLLGPCGRWLSSLRPAPAFVGGALAWLLIGGLLAFAAWALQRELLAAPVLLAVPLLAVCFKPTWAWRMLRDEVAAVEAALQQHGETAARERLAQLVSRDLAGSDGGLLRETAIETLAENLNDSVVAPLFWAALLGLPGAVLYRYANTADAMWGYRGRYEWAGKWAARADDGLSWLPARLTGLALAPLKAWPGLPTEARATPSPNGGWPMGAMALRLGVRLRKPGVYALHAQAPGPGPAHVQQALRAAGAVAWGAAALAAAAWAVRG